MNLIQCQNLLQGFLDKAQEVPAELVKEDF